MGPLHTAAVPSLQRHTGNAAVAQLLAERRPLVQRVPAEADPPALVSPELASPRCQEAYSNRAKPLFEGETSEGIGALQAALTQIGFGSGFQKTEKKGHADQIYGPETRKAVRAFQEHHDVRPVGGSQAGHKTLLALDRALGAPRSTVPAPSAGPSVSLPTKIQTGEKPGSVEKNGKVVQEPETKAATTQTEDKDDDDPKEVTGKLSIAVGGQQIWSSTDPPDAPNATKNFFCDHGVLQMSGQILIPWERNRGRKLKLFPEFDVQIDFVGPAACNTQPSVGVQINAAKLQLSKGVELAANASLGLQGPPTGWVLGASIEADLLKDALLKNSEVDLVIQGGGLFIPKQEGVNKSTIIGQGGLQLVLKYTF